MRRGEFVSLVGPSGCGKSTLLRIIAGLRPATSGAVRVDGVPVIAPIRNIGVVFQAPVLLKWRTVLDNVLLPAELAGLGTASYRQRAMALLRLVAVGDIPAVTICKASGPAWKTPRASFSLGFVDGNAPTVLAETIVGTVLLRKPGADESAHFWKCQALPVAGRSGGPLLDPDGTLLGICSGGDGKSSYYTHLDEIRRFLRRNGLRHLTD